MRRIILILFVLLMQFSFAIRAVTKEEEIKFLKSIGLNKEKIEILGTALLEKNKKMSLALEESRKYRKENIGLSKEEYNLYLNKKIKKVENDFNKELSSFLNFYQKKRILEYYSRVY